MFRIFMVCCLSYFATISDAGKASFIVPCTLDDKTCLVSSSQAAVPIIAAGIPALGVGTMDPFHLDTVNGDTNDLKLTFNNVQVSGASKCKILKVEINDDQSKLYFVLETPFVATGQYIVNGTKFIHVEGNGDFKLETEKMWLSVDADLTTVVGSDGEKHWHVDSFVFDFDPKEKIYIHLHNLFNGDEEKGNAFLTILDKSWKEVSSEFGKPFLKAFIDKTKINVNKLFDAVPMGELHKS